MRKGARHFTGTVNPIKRELDKVQYQKAGGNQWEEITWEKAFEMMAERIKDARDKTFIEKENNVTVTVQLGLSVSVVQLLTMKSACMVPVRAFNGDKVPGHQARFDTAQQSPVWGLHSVAGAMTNHWIDIRNADVVFIIAVTQREPSDFF